MLVSLFCLPQSCPAYNFLLQLRITCREVSLVKSFISIFRAVNAAYRKACSTRLSFGREQYESFFSELEQLSDLGRHNDVPQVCLNKISRQIEAQGSFIAHQPFQFNFKGSTFRQYVKGVFVIDYSSLTAI